MSRLQRLRNWYGHAFAVDTGGDELDEHDRDLVLRLADFIVKRRMSAPALMVLETGRPLNFVGSQALAFLSPFLTLIFHRSDYERFVLLLDRRRSIDFLVDAIVSRENDYSAN
ncbi:MAG: hypothetical protein VX733_03580 [Candidatus Latescibacterota bacterium]|nr:hypothetical protein [Candidatus Latescibacterota bacterium]